MRTELIIEPGDGGPAATGRLQTPRRRRSLHSEVYPVVLLLNRRSSQLRFPNDLRRAEACHASKRTFEDRELDGTGVSNCARPP